MHHYPWKKTATSALVLLSFALPAASQAATRCGSFEMVPVNGRIQHVTTLPDGQIWGVGPSATDPTLPVLRHFNGQSWSEITLPQEIDGFAVSTIESTSNGDIWVAATPAAEAAVKAKNASSRMTNMAGDC